MLTTETKQRLVIAGTLIRMLFDLKEEEEIDSEEAIDYCIKNVPKGMEHIAKNLEENREEAIELLGDIFK